MLIQIKHDGVGGAGGVVRRQPVSVLKYTPHEEAEVLSEVLEAHPEHTVVSLAFLLITDGPRLISPQVRFVTPITIPLEVTPWIPDFNDGDFISST